MGMVLMFVMPILVFIYGIVGIIKDKNIVMGIVGLNLGIAHLFMMIFSYFMRYMFYSPYY